LTLNLCKREGKPHVVVDASKVSAVEATAEIARFVEKHEIHVLNVAGPRGERVGAGHAYAAKTVGEVIGRYQET
jgi:beta-xylosidase